MIEPIYFSLYEKVPNYSVRIFKSTRWALENGVSLEVSIIGTSHRVISRSGEECLTEFITCFDRKLPENALDRVCLQAGVVHAREYRSGNLVYRVNVEQISKVYNTMNEFINSLGGITPVEVLTRVRRHAGPFWDATAFYWFSVEHEHLLYGSYLSRKWYFHCQPDYN
jgi:hypothetical protein